MPQAVAAPFIALANGLLMAGASVGFAVYTAGTLYYATVGFLLNKATSALTRRPKTGESRGLEVSIVDSTADARIIYGEVRVGGVNMIPLYSSGSNGRYAHQVLALAVHEIDSFQEFFFDQDALPTPGSITGASTDGVIGSGKYANRAWVRGYRGTMTQNVDWIINNAFPFTWGTTARGRGVAYIAVQYDYGDGKLYRSLPSVTARVRGKRVYDPRLDSTNGGSGSHRYTDPTTWAWSSNPALCWADYMCASYGFGADPATDINWPSVIAAANVCDALVPDRNSSGTPVDKRYTCNGVLVNRRDSLRSNARGLVDAMMGRMWNLNGQWYCAAGAWTAPAWSIAKEDWLSIDSIQAAAPRDGGRHNSVRCFYVDPFRNWQRVESYPRSNSTYRSADASEILEVEMEQPLCTDEDEAQRKAEFLLRQSRNGVRLVGVLGPKFLKMRTFDTVSVTFAELGWTSKTFRIAAMDINEEGSVRVALVEEQSTDWTDLTSGEYSAPSTATLPAVNPTTPSAPSFALSNVINGTIHFSLGDPVVRPRDTRFQIIRSTNSGNAAVGTVVYDGLSQEVDLPAPNSLHWYWGRTYASSYFSEYTPNTFGVAGIPARVVPMGFTVTNQSSRAVANRDFVMATTYTAPFDAVVYGSLVYTGFAEFGETGGVRLGAFIPSSVDAGGGAVNSFGGSYPSSVWLGSGVTLPSASTGVATFGDDGTINVNSGTTLLIGGVVTAATGYVVMRGGSLVLQASPR